MVKTQIHHVALHCSDKEKAETFFTKILGVPLEKTFTISPEITNSIFGIKENIEINVYGEGKTRFEVFITEKMSKPVFEHICIEVKDKDEFIECCKKYSLDPWFVQKNGKKLLFVKDFSGNLFEVKEKTV